ncbi:unnamed protein product [Urochloa humidicola]
MRTSLSLAAAAVFLLLLLTTMGAEAIRLDAESRAAVSQSQQQTVDKPSENLAQKGAPVKSSVGESEMKTSIASVKSSVADESETKRSIASVKSSVGESETKRSIAGQEVRATAAHKLPEFHEDYYGASVHEPRHH